MEIERISAERIARPVQSEACKQMPAKMEGQFEAVLLQSMLKADCIDQYFTEEATGHPVIPALSESHDTEVSLPVSANPIQNTGPIRQPSEDINTIDDFVKSLWPYARQTSTRLGLDPALLMAQVALETGWGQFVAKNAEGQGSNNLFNIKARKEELSVQVNTTEYIHNTPVKTMASFRQYASMEESFNDYLALIQGDRYKNALANASDSERYIQALHAAGYATDPDYANKILSIYHGEALQQALVRNGCTSDSYSA
jgi:flagellar rod assembly protein/muramidase FlgJ